MYKIHSRFDEITLCEWHECTGCAPAPSRQEGARRWFGAMLIDDAQQAGLRQLAHRLGDGLGLSAVLPFQLLDRLVDEVADGRLRICGKGGVAPYEVAMEFATGMAPPGEPPPPVRRSASAPAAAPEPEAKTLPPVDVADMVRVLTAAAAEGMPFCEICAEHAKRTQAALA